MIKCDNCGHENPDDATICYRCQSFLDPERIGKTQLKGDTDYEEPEPRWGVARLTGSLILDVEDMDKRFVVPASEIDEFGIQLKDYDRGLIDFPAMRDGRIVLLCWQIEDGDKILWWHDIETGFAGRQPL